MGFHQDFADPETQADSGYIILFLNVKTLETLEKSGLVFNRNLYSLIANADN